uniref:Uncharacterized protein n=1 Tax=Cucumis sativus TaxID=3659 RepID=A0A0A0LWZ7_CUCSA
MIRLENKAPVHSGIACLGSKGLSVLGGVVPTLYEEWKMNQKYSGLSRESMRLSQGGDVDGPPPFEKLQVGAPSQKLGQKGKSSCQYFSLSAYILVLLLFLLYCLLRLLLKLLPLLSSLKIYHLEWQVLGLGSLAILDAY